VAPQADTKGLISTFLAYGLWGFFPLYFLLLDASGAIEIVAHRTVWTLVFCIIGVTVVAGWGRVREVFSSRRLVATLILAGAFLSVNWLIYIYAVLTDRVVDGALGYFINPLVTVALAVTIQKEKVRPAQVAALLIGLAAVLVIAVGVGHVPWIGLGLAFSFGFYTLAKSKVGHRVTAFIGLGAEMVAVIPLALGFIIYLQIAGTGTFTTVSGWYTLALMGTGVVTAVPLLLFAIGAARLPMVTLAFMQYIAPILQFLVGVVILREEMPVARWIGFILIWIALIVLSWDIVRRARTRAA